jgi:hypothetical protein
VYETEREREREREERETENRKKKISLNNKHSNLTSIQAGYTKRFSLL